MITLYRNVVGKLEAQDRRRGKMFLCPSHDDSDPSLSVNEGRDGIALVKCHAGCAFQDIMSALDGDVVAHANGQPSTAVTKDEADQALRNRGLRSDTIAYFRITFNGRDSWTFPLGANQGVKSKSVHGSTYKNPAGQSARLYHLKPCCDAEVAWLVEGEPDVWTAHQGGLKAFSFTTGANTTPSDTMLDEINAANIAQINVCYDHDSPGCQGAKKVSAAFTRAGITHTVRDIGGLVPPGGDVTTLYNNLGCDDGAFRETMTALPVQAKDSAVSLAFRHIRELLTEPDEALAWLVDDLLPAGGLSVLVGKPKAGKSTLARALAVAVARGEPWLGRNAAQGTVLYLVLDRDPRRALRQHFRELGATQEDPIYLFDGRVPADALSKLHAAAAEHQPTLIVVDTMQRLVRGKDLNDYASVTLILEPLLNLARDAGAHVCLLHHSPKHETNFAGDAPLGSTAIAGTVDTVLLVRRREQYRTLTTVQRCGDDLNETVVTLDAEQRPTIGGTREQYEISEVGRRIVAYLDTQAEPVPQPDIRENVEGRTQRIVSALRVLVEDENVVISGAGQRNDPYCYALSEKSVSAFPSTMGETRETKPEEDLSASESKTYSFPTFWDNFEPVEESRETLFPTFEAEIRDLIRGRPDLTGNDILDRYPFCRDDVKQILSALQDG